MGLLKRAFGMLGRYYVVLAIIFLNTLLLFVAVNLIADAILHTEEHYEKKAAQAGTPISFRRFHESLVPVHPNLTREQIGELIAETRTLTQIYEPFSQFKDKPCSGKYINIDPRGFRFIKNQKPWPPADGDLVIFMFGGSTTFGCGVQDDATIASYLQELLSQRGIPASVYNFGRGNHFSVQERIVFEKVLMEGHVPHVAIFLDGLNDFFHYDGLPAHTKSLKQFMDDGQIPESQKAIRALPVAKLVKKHLYSSQNEFDSTRLFKASSSEQQLNYIKSVFERYKMNKKITEAISKGFDIIPIFVWQPVPVYKYDAQFNIFGGFNYNSYFPALQAGYDFVGKQIESTDLGANFIWAADIQENQKKPLYVDASHYSSEMAKMLAEFIINSIAERGLVPAIGKSNKPSE